MHSRLRGAGAASGRGAASFVAETLLRAGRAGAQGPLLVRADSGFYSQKVVDACTRHGARFSITVRLQRQVNMPIAEIPEEAWTPIPYWLEARPTLPRSYPSMPLPTQARLAREHPAGALPA